MLIEQTRLTRETGWAAARPGKMEEKANPTLPISCVVRKLILKQRVEGLRDVAGKQTTLAGFIRAGKYPLLPLLRNADLTTKR